MDVFSPALEIRNAGSLVDCISPASRNKKKQERPVNIFTLTLKIKTVSKSGRLYQPKSQKSGRVGTSGDVFSPAP